jgi:hypothetical protein
MQVRLGVSAVCQHVQVFILKQQKSDQRIQAVCQLMQVNQKPQPELEFCPKVSSEVCSCELVLRFCLSLRIQKVPTGLSFNSICFLFRWGRPQQLGSSRHSSSSKEFGT